MSNPTGGRLMTADEGIPLGRVAGFPLSAHWSVLVIAWLFTWSLATTLPAVAPGYAASTYWLAGVCGAAILLASLLAHELTHALVASRAGIDVLSVKLWLFGGIARLGGDAKTPREAFWIAASGPAVSLGLAAVFAGTASGLEAVGAAPIVVAVGWWLSGINLLLGLFNLLPGAPLDGGRVLRAFLWRRHGDAVRAAVGAARAGRVVAYVLIAMGLLEFLVGSIVGGAWMAFLGWFLLVAARDEEMSVIARQSLAGLTVADVMTPRPHTAPGGISVEDFIQRYLLGDRHSSYPVANPDGVVTGLITLKELRGVAPEHRATTMIRDVAVPRDQVTTVGLHEPVVALLERLAPTGDGRALVVDPDGRVVGIVTPSDITRVIDVRSIAMPAFSR